MEENGRLLSHAGKVINTVSFLVDSVGDESKAETLNDALVKLVRSHLKKKVGDVEFRNLGLVLIDFICEYNNRRENSTPETSPRETTSEPRIVAAWTKLYSVILDLVKREEANLRA